MSKKKLYSDSRWHDHPTLEQLKKSLQNVPKIKDTPEQARKKEKFLAELKQDDEKDQQIADLKAQLQREKDLQSTREAFREDGLDVPNEVLAMVVSTDQQQTVNNISAITDFVNSIRDTAKKEALRGTTPRSNGKPANGMSKADIRKIKDPLKRVKAIKDNMSIYE